MGAVIAFAAAIGFGWVLKERAGTEAAKAETASLRTATIQTGDIQKTIRISGIVAAERFAALMAPQLRGSRGNSGGYGSGGAKSLVGNASSSSSSSTSSTTSGSTTSSSSSSSPSAAGSSTVGAATSTNTAVTGQTAASGTPGAPASSLGSIRGTQNRFGDRQAAQSSANKPPTQGNNAGGSSALGSNGLGSTASNLLGTGGSGGGTPGGGGGGGDSDFSLVLVEVAKPGSHVKKGAIVAEFDRQYQLNRLDDYKATVLQLNANLKHLVADQAVAKEAREQLVRGGKATLDKALLDLKTAEVRSAIEAEDLKLAAEEAEAHYKELLEERKLLEQSQRSELRAAEIDRNQAKIELDRATANVDRMIVRAPMDGVVVMQTIWRGGDFGQVQQGDQIWPGMTFMQIVDPTSMVIMANLNQVDVESVRLGLKAVARLDAYPGSEFPAHVYGVGAMTKPGVWRPNYMREIPVRLKLERIDDRVIPDLSASSEILLGREEHAAIAPLSAVFQDPGAHPFVLLRTSAGWQRREIQLGLANHVAAAVRSGLSAGDVVAVERFAAVKPPS